MDDASRRARAWLTALALLVALLVGANLAWHVLRAPPVAVKVPLQPPR